jgi:arginase
MNPGINPNIALIGVPMDLGADRRGVDMGPSAIRCAGIEKKLEQIGYTVQDRGDLVVRRGKFASQPATNLKYLEEIAKVNEELCRNVAEEIGKGNFPLVIGGDHSIAIGSIAGVWQHHKKIGVIWYDSHGDVNTADTSPSGNIHGMPLAVALGYGHERLTAIGGPAAKVHPENVVIIGARCIDQGERIFLKEKGISVYTMHELDQLGMSRVIEQALDIVTKSTDAVHLSLDLDALDPYHAPGVGTPVPGGITYRESHLAMELLSEAGVVTSADVVEVNPILDCKNQTASVAVALMGSLFGETII